MKRYAALLRAVNLAGKNKVPMADLREMAADLGLHDPRTLLQSGNLVFESDGRAPAQLESALEKAAKKNFGLDTDFFVRTPAEWKGIIGANPFPDEAESDPGRLLVVFLKGAPGPEQVEALREAIVGREVVQTRGREAFIVYPDGIGRSRLTNKRIEKHLGVRGTGRNWNTVLKVGALLGV